MKQVGQIVIFKFPQTNIEPGSLDFKESGLKIKSVIRVSRSAVVSGDILEGTIGEISKERFIRIRENLSHWIRTGKVNATLVDEN